MAEDRTGLMAGRTRLRSSAAGLGQWASRARRWRSRKSFHNDVKASPSINLYARFTRTSSFRVDGHTSIFARKYALARGVNARALEPGLKAGKMANSITVNA
jgi:hypothetical protein